MDKKNEKKKTSSTFEKKSKPPHDWHLTEQDKAFCEPVTSVRIES